MIGRTFSHYRIIEKIGEGGMGVVYRAEDTRLARTVALKFLPAELTGDADAKKRFVREAKAASTLDHPGICTIYEIDEAEGQTFIAMAFVQGQSLKQKVESGPLKLDEVVAIAIQIAEGLQEAHEKGIVHRDIKSANIMVTPKCQVRIMDFGLAKLAGGTRITNVAATVGTAAYMSPEQVRGDELNCQTDIWSLGVVIYEMVTGRLPFESLYEHAVWYSIVNETPEPITTLRDGVSAELERIVEKAMAKRRDERYEHLREMLVDLRALQKEDEIRIADDRSAQSGSGRKSIAVLPFVSLSQDKTDEYFSDGTTDDIITQVSKIHDLKVISRTSVMLYKDSKKNLRQIGKELGVVTILEGSVRRYGDRVRIVAQLVDAQTDDHLWVETYDREMKDVFAIQSDVAEKIASALKAELSPVERRLIQKKPTANTTAYSYYLKGREYYYRYRKQDNDAAIELFKKAVETDPGYAVAWAGLGDAYAQGFSRHGMPVEWLDRAMEASQKASALDGDSAEAYKALGLTFACKGLYDKALEAYHRAADLNPNYAPAIGNIGVLYFNMGELDKASPWLRKAIAISPTTVLPYTCLGDACRQFGDFANAEKWLTKALELQPDYADANCYLAGLYLLEGKHREANDQIRRALTTNPDNPRVLDVAGWVSACAGDLATAKEYFQRSVTLNKSFDTDPDALSGIGLGHILLKEGKREEATKLLASAFMLQERRIKEGDVIPDRPCNLARICAIEGRKTESYAWLEKAISKGWKDYMVGLRDPWFENLHDDERFKEMMTDLKAKVEELCRSTGAG